MQINKIIKKIKEQQPQYTFNGLMSDSVEENKEKILHKIKENINLEIVELIIQGKRIVNENKQMIGEEIILKRPEGIEIRAILLRPKTLQKIPLVLVCPGRNATIERVTGIEKPLYKDENIAELLAKKNIATITVEYGVLGAIGNDVCDGRDEINLTQLLASLNNKSLLEFVLEDLLSCLKWAENQSWCDQENIGIFGRSLGGFVATYIALYHATKKSVAISNCLCTYTYLFQDKFLANGLSAIPGILNYADFSDLIIATNPEHLYLQYGKKDPYFNVDESRRVCNQINSIYKSNNQGKTLKIDCTEEGHGTDSKKVIDFFRNTLTN